MNVRILATALVISSLFSAAGSSMSEEQTAPLLVTGIDGDRFWGALGGDVTYVELSREGVCFSFEEPRKMGGVSSAVLAIYGTVDDARMGFQFSSILMSVPPDSGQFYVGDETYLWSTGNDSSGTILFRVKNTLVRFIWSSGIETAKDFAKKIDSLLSSSHRAVKKGHFAPLPSIEEIPLSKTTKVLETFQISPQYEGFGKKALRTMVWAPEFSEINVTREGQIRLKAPAEEGEYRVTVIAATDECVVVKRQFTVVVRK